MFGGIVDWRAYKLRMSEKRRILDIKLVEVQEEVPEYNKELEIAENAKAHVLQELEITKRLIEEIKMNLERTRIEEEQARQNFRFAEMHIEEIKQGISDEASVAAKALLCVANARHKASLIELKRVRNEVEDLKGQCLEFTKEKKKAVMKAEDMISASTEIEKWVEELTLELMAARESMELVHASHLDAEEKRLATVLDKDQETLKQEKEMKIAEEEIQRLTEKLSASNGLKAKLETASSMLLNLKAELAAYMEAKLDSKTNDIEDERALTVELEEAKQGDRATLSALDSTMKELEEAKFKIQKAREEVKFLRVTAKSELEREKVKFATMRQREGITAVTVSALEAELTKTKSEIEEVQTREKEARDNC